MWTWLSRLFQSKIDRLARKAEVDGRFEDAARLWTEAGRRDEACRLLTRAAETARNLSDRRAFLVRAHAVAPTEALRLETKKLIGVVVLQECETMPPRNDEERMRLSEAATDLEAGGAFREAARAWELLGERESMERALVLSGDVESYEKHADDDVRRERNELRRRHVSESLQSSWKSGDRAGAIAAADEWLATHDDAEIRALRDDRAATLLQTGRLEARIDGVTHLFTGKLPATLGREADIVVRGASVSREHCAIEVQGDGLVLRDNGSRNGTQVEGMTLAGAVPVREGLAFSLGSDLTLKVVRVDTTSVLLEIDRGMDRGRRIVVVRTGWMSPLGRVRFDGRRVLIDPDQPLNLLGQRVAATITLARGDRLERDGIVMEVIGG